MTVGRRGSCPNPNIPLAGLRMVYPILFFYYERGVTNAKYRTTDRFRNSSYAYEEICKLSTKKKDERVSWVCWIFQSKSLWKIPFNTSQCVWK